MNNIFKLGRGYLDGLKYRIIEEHGRVYFVHIDSKNLTECLERNGVKDIDSLFLYWNNNGRNRYEIVDYSKPTQQIRVGVITNTRLNFRMWLESNYMASISRVIRQSGKNIRLGNTLYRNITHMDDMIGCRFDYFIDTDSAHLNRDIDMINQSKIHCMIL
jgi:hypothetical protein